MRTLRLGSRTGDGPPTYEFRTRQGLHSYDAFRDAELLALEHCWEYDLGDLLVVQANYGVIGTVLAERAASVTMTETSARAADCCRRNADANGATADVRCVPTVRDLDDRFDAAVYAPKPYAPVDVVRQRIADALELLRPGSTVFVAGRTAEGLARYRSTLDDLANATVVAERDGVTLVRADRPTAVDPPTFVETKRHSESVDGVEMELVTEPGLFAAGGLDDGTRLLLETVDAADGDRVLDLCCGAGPMGAYAGLMADCSLVCTDDCTRATHCAERTLAANRVNGTVVTADGVDGVRDRRFDLVLCNPPTHAGSGVLRDLFDGAADVLVADGRFVLVHHRHLDLSSQLRAFETVQRVATGSEHVVRVARR